MQQIDEEILDAFNSYIVNIVQTEIKKALDKLALEIFRNVKVTSVISTGSGADTEVSCATVQDMATGEIIKDVPNESGKIIEVGDIVRLYETRGNYHNQYIGLNFGKE